jgi:hypothetical protein
VHLQSTRRFVVMKRPRHLCRVDGFDLLAKQRAFADSDRKYKNSGGKFRRKHKNLASRRRRRVKSRLFCSPPPLPASARRAYGLLKSVPMGPLRVRNQIGRLCYCRLEAKLINYFRLSDGGRTQARTVGPLIKSQWISGYWRRLGRAAPDLAVEMANRENSHPAVHFRLKESSNRMI